MFCLSVCQIRCIDLYGVSCFALGIRIAKIDCARIDELGTFI